ncbi:DUF4240 domain-containing protein [Streptomyces sp. NPDC085995]|uniref:DUF4240 domain-containing protein n=1 Tax=Streptomyces sp. NPDC085995 TaxID=3154861 RepID=UPI003432DFE6
MDTETFWRLVDAARAADKPPHAALSDLLAAQGEEHVLAFEACMDRLDTAIDRWGVWAAGCLVGGGCSDGSFMDFKAGLIGPGRAWYERVVRCPDDLAEHPGIRRAAATGDQEAVFREELGSVGPDCYRRFTGDEDDFSPASDRHRTARGLDGGGEHDMGEDFGFDDPDERHRRLPRLAALYRAEGQQ